LAALLGILLFAIPLAAWGQSDPSNFETVLNIPPEVLPASIDPSTQINLGEGGEIYVIEVGTGVELNVAGGSVNLLVASPGGITNINGGTVYEVPVYSDSEVYVRGGFVDEIFQVDTSDGFVELVGGEFRLNGATVAGTSIHAVYGDVLSGTLSDGAQFIFSPPLGSVPLTLDATLTTVALPIVNPAPIVIDAANPTGPGGLRAGQSLILQTGGELSDNFVAVSATLNIEGGSIGVGTEVSESIINMSGGSVDDGFDAYGGSVVNVSGGTLGSSVEAHAGSTFHIDGGKIGGFLTANAGSVIDIFGGTVGLGFTAQAGSNVKIQGGTVGGGFTAAADSDVEIVGGEFELNGVAVAGPIAALTPTDVLSGVFSDGTPFVFSEFRNPVFGNVLNDYIAGVTLTAVELPTASPAPIVVDGSTGNVPAGLRAGQSLTLKEGGVLRDDFTAIRASLDVEGGEVGDWADVVESTVNISGGRFGTGLSVLRDSFAEISGGRLGPLFNASDGSVVVITGGTIENGANANDGSVFHISGGEIDNSFQANAGSVVNIRGGDFSGFFNANAGSTVNISGSTIGESHSFQADSGSTVNLFGTEFRLDGKLLEGLTLNEALVISDRGNNVVLSGLLEDGSSFSFGLNLSDNHGQQDFFATDALLTVTRVSKLAGDYNNDGAVDAADYTVWRNHLGAPAGSLLNDVDGGKIGTTQYATWRANFGASVMATANGIQAPEPSTLLLLMATCPFAFVRRTLVGS